jgi:hypothetical protein
MLSLAESFSRIPGVVAVVLGGSRARGEERPDSDWDFGLYYRGSQHPIDPADVRALGHPGTVFAPGEWGRIVNGGAWLTIDGEPVDLIYRDLDQVEHWLAEAVAGRFEVSREVGYVAGIATYVPVGELAICRPLHGEPLPRPAFPDALRRSAPPWWRNVAAGALVNAAAHARIGDVSACVANVAQALLAAAQARVAERGEWALNEKGLLRRADLDAAGAVLARPGTTPRELADLVNRARGQLDLPSWGR